MPFPWRKQLRHAIRRVCTMNSPTIYTRSNDATHSWLVTCRSKSCRRSLCRFWPVFGHRIINATRHTTRATAIRIDTAREGVPCYSPFFVFVWPSIAVCSVILAAVSVLWNVVDILRLVSILLRWLFLWFVCNIRCAHATKPLRNLLPKKNGKNQNNSKTDIIQIGSNNLQTNKSPAFKI